MLKRKFFHTLKADGIHGERYVTRQQLRQVLFEYIEVAFKKWVVNSRVICDIRDYTLLEVF